MNKEQKELIILVVYLILPATLLRISSELIPNIIISGLGAMTGFFVYHLLKQKTSAIRIVGIIILSLIAGAVTRLQI